MLATARRSPDDAGAEAEVVWHTRPAHTNDLASRLTVADAVTDVRAAADWCSVASGGAGAVREAAEWLLHARGQWDSLLAEFG